MANSLKKQTQGDAMNLPPGIDRLPTQDGIPRYRVRIRIKGHKPLSKNFKSLTHAKQWKRVTEGQIEKGLYVSFSKADQYTVGAAIDKYLKEVLPHKPKDSKNVERHLLRWKKELGHLKLSRLNQSMIAEVRDQMLSEKIDETKFRSNTTVKRYLSSLSTVFSYAVREWQWMNENPCLKVKKPKEPPGRVRYLTKEELERIMNTCKQSKNKALFLIFLIALTTGARKSEILGLKGKDIDLENGFLHLTDTKNGNNRSIPITESIAKLLKERKTHSDAHLFPSENDPSQPCCIRSAWETAIEKAQIQDFRFHDIRHTTASYLAMDGFSMKEVSFLLGHAGQQSTDRYSHLPQEHKRRLANRIEERLNEESD
jgi:integrase